MNALKPHLRGLPSYPYKKVEAAVKLDQNESPYDLPPEIKAKAAERLARADWNRYPHLHAEDVREKLAHWLGWPMDGLVLSPGSNLLIQALVQAASRVLDTAPSFPHYAMSAQLSAARYQAFPLRDGFGLPLEELLSAMDPAEPGVVFLPNPHAPSGQLFAEPDVQALARKAQETGWLLVIDEAYHQFSGSDYAPLASENPSVALLRTFSKAWGLGGIRAGYLMGSAEVCAAVQNLIPPFGLPVHTAAILHTVLEHPGYVAGIVEAVLDERQKLVQALRNHPVWEAYPSQTNFLLVRTPDAADAHAELLKRGVLVRRQDHYAGLEGCIRVTVGTPAENRRFVEAAFALAEVRSA